MIIQIASSKSVKQIDKNTDSVHLFIQFYIDADPIRQSEIITCLHNNIRNPNITKIHMLNERIYTNEEFRCRSEKLIQTNIGKRLLYSDIFKYIDENNISGYIIISNSDILFNSTLENLLYSDIHLHKKIYAQVRYEFNSIDPSLSRILGPRWDSQDVWILHSNFIMKPECEKMLRFHMGKPGCDNKIIYLFSILGFEILNDPDFIKCYHYHDSNQRSYTKKDVISMPWGVVEPAGYCTQPNTNAIMSNCKDQLASSPRFSDNALLYEYILSKISKGESFIIPRIAGIENNYAVIGNTLSIHKSISSDTNNYINKSVGILQRNAGIKLRNSDDIMEYSQKYLKAFDNCEIYTGWEKSGNVYPHISESHDFITQQYYNKQILWAFSLDIFHYIFNTPWTHALRGKRILIISSFEKSIQEKLPIREKIYGVDLFPECSFVTIIPPQTQCEFNSGDSYFGDHLSKFKQELDEIKDTYDIALVSCGGYGNLVCNYIFESGKSAIYVGGVLQMYFGILGGRWLKERPDVVRIFLNEHWSRPKQEEKPTGYQNIEGGCYW